MGELKVSFAYYHCASCHRGYHLGREELGLGGGVVTPGCEEVVALAGVVGSFADSAERVLRKLSGVRLSESTVERITESAGERLSEELAGGGSLGPEAQWRWQRDAAGRSCAYVSLDATGVRQQGEGGSRAEGKMAYVAMVYNPSSAHDPSRPGPRQVRYISGFYDLDTLGAQLHREALAVGWAKAEQQIAISDGGNGLEEVLRRYFPRAECILDFWHAKEHLLKLAKELYPQDEAARQAWLNEACHRLKHEGGAATRRWLEGLDLSGASGSLLEVYRQEVQYFRNHEHRMDYPRYLRNGWQIGSGAVESACKTVVGSRLKGRGMRWGESGANAVCHLRALYLSDPTCWDTFWHSST